MNQKNYDALMAVWDFAKENDIDYLDLNQYLEEMDFAFGVDSETWHNTNWGAYKNSEIISEYLLKNYKFNHVDNEDVNRNLSYLKKSTLFGLLLNQVDPYNFFKYASKFDGIIIIKYNGYYKTSIESAENALLNEMGFEYDFINNRNTNYYGVSVNGKLKGYDNKEFKTIDRKSVV